MMLHPGTNKLLPLPFFHHLKARFSKHILEHRQMPGQAGRASERGAIWFGRSAHSMDRRRRDEVLRARSEAWQQV